MGTLRTCALISLSAIAACGGGDSKPDALVVIIPDAAVDAPPDAFEPVFDFSCLANPAPTDADADVTLSGVAVELVVNGTTPNIEPSHAATVAICQADCEDADELDSQTTAATGCPATGCPFTSATLATGGTPFDVYLRVTKTGNRTTFVYPPSPLTTNYANIPALTFTNTALSLLALAGITQDADKGNLILAITDCSDLPITDTDNITLVITQGGTAVSGTTELSLSSFSAMLAGTYAVFNVPPGVTSIGATYKGNSLQAHDVGVVMGATTATIVRPGF